MRDTRQKRKLRKELGLLDVYAIATGTTLSAGFFLMPGLAAEQAGPALILAYVLAALPLIPAMFSIVELSTAMPRAGGVYYFLDRTLGPLIGMVGGLGTWFALTFKVSFALIGMGAYLSLFFPDISIVPVAVALAIAIGVLNLFSTKKSGGFQSVLVVILLSILAIFIIGGLPEVSEAHFQNFLGSGWPAILSTTGLVYISYVGVTTVASLSEEVQNPERNLPLGIFLALGTALVIYVLGTVVMVGVLPPEELSGNMTPVASAAKYYLGDIGVVVVSIAAITAFISVANAGTLSASRYPLAMARDHLMPRSLYKLGKKGTPIVAIALTVGIIVIILLLFDPVRIAKLASSFQLLMFAFICLAVIVMRESHIDAYDPGFKSPFYPWLQIFGILSPLLLIMQMGLIPIVFSLGLVLMGFLWYAYYARGKIARTGAIYHVFERLGRSRYDGLDHELRGILKEKGLREEDPYDQIVARSLVIDLKSATEFVDLVEQVSGWLSQIVPHNASELKQLFMEGTRIGATPVTHGVALPHLRMDGLEQAEMILVRCRDGIHICFKNPLTEEDEEDIVNATFFLISPEKNPGQHLRMLGQIAGRVDEDDFTEQWNTAAGENELKEVLLRDERSLSIIIRGDTATKELVNHALRDVPLPEGCLVTWLRRDNEVVVPGGNTVIREGDRLTIIGSPEAIKEVRRRYGKRGGDTR